MVNHAIKGKVRALNWIEGHLPDAFFKDERINIEAARQELEQLLNESSKRSEERQKAACPYRKLNPYEGMMQTTQLGQWRYLARSANCTFVRCALSQ